MGDAPLAMMHANDINVAYPGFQPMAAWFGCGVNPGGQLGGAEETKTRLYPNHSPRQAGRQNHRLTTKAKG